MPFASGRRGISSSSSSSSPSMADRDAVGPELGKQTCAGVCHIRLDLGKKKDLLVYCV